MSVKQWHMIRHYVLQGIKIVSAAAGVTQSIFISAEGVGYWCGEGMGELKNVRFQS